MCLSQVTLAFVCSFRNFSFCMHLGMAFNFSLKVHCSSVNQYMVLQKIILSLYCMASDSRDKKKKKDI